MNKQKDGGASTPTTGRGTKPTGGRRLRNFPYEYLNEAINYDLRAIFVAIPKTGTTNVRDQMRPKGRFMLDCSHLNIRQIRDLIYPFELTESLAQCRQFPTRNVDDDQQVRARAQAIFQNFFKFSAVRNPWARAVSLYSRREGIQMSSTLSFDEFIRTHHYASDTCGFPTLHVNQADWLAGETGKLLTDFVYKLEEFDTAIDTIREMTDGRVILKAQHANRNETSLSTSYRDVYTDETRALIATRFQKDIDLFKYSF